MWYRYHHLFADLLQARLRQSLPADVITTLHSRASQWYERNGFGIESVNHALAAQGCLGGRARRRLAQPVADMTERWIIAVLRHRHFTSLAQLNEVIAGLVARYSNPLAKIGPGFV